ncbi:transglutaminase family protein [Phenylobacterium sp. J367]|uniref:transglutaminase-like domain-containing protein n=1 Tax=Phenylobacterium sp. J367 TaxID=2898435 RepID=UPI002150E0D9|nr:transglutaminase family protein [Phenylobacterium sp. J367]MCR5879314.1 transglutaminase family protein [Phenylobacterium sp. J367]
MRIRAGYEISYDSPAPTPMLLMLNVRPELRGHLESPDTIFTDPPVPVRLYTDLFGNTCARLVAPAGRLTLSSDFVIRSDEAPDPVVADAVQHPVEDLPDEVIQFLLGSRYCETAPLNDLAWKLFADTPPGWARVQAIVDYAHQRITFGYEHARPTKTAHEAHEEGCGVCRDYAHLAITLCRCMNIPARYCTGYLGDLRVPPSGAPMDFSAWFQVWLGGAWRTFDARHNKPRVGRILQAVGRDATDVAITTHFGPSALVGFKVITEELPA